jgi:hypothetical protein
MNKLDDNFEKLKQSMLEKKLKAEAVNKNICKNVDVNTDVDTNVNIDVNRNTNTSVDKDVNKNIYIDDDIDVYTNVHKNTNISDYNDVNNNVNKFVIKPKECEQAPVRYTMYLKPDTIEKIGHYSKLLNLGKSEFAQKIFEYFLNNIEIIE